MRINIIDIAAVAVILLIAFINARKGLFKSLTNCIAYVASVFISRMAANPVSRLIYDRALSDRITAYLDSVIPDGKTVMLAITDTLPENALKIADFFKLLPDADAAAAKINTALSIEKIETTYIMPIVMKILVIISTVALFFIAALALRIAANFINRILFKKKKGVLPFVNKTLGFGLGLVIGLLISGVGCAVLDLVAPLVNNAGLVSLADGSYICSFIAGLIK